MVKVLGSLVVVGAVAVGAVIWLGPEMTWPSEEGAAAPAPVEPLQTQAAAAVEAPAPRIGPEIDMLRVEKDGTAIVSGRGRPGAQVELMVDETPAGTASADGQGDFALLLNLPVSVQPQSLRLRETDAEGTVTDGAQTFIVETETPPAPDPVTRTPRDVASSLEGGEAAGPARPVVAVEPSLADLGLPGEAQGADAPSVTETEDFASDEAEAAGEAMRMAAGDDAGNSGVVSVTSEPPREEDTSLSASEVTASGAEVRTAETTGVSSEVNQQAVATTGMEAPMPSVETPEAGAGPEGSVDVAQIEPRRDDIDRPSELTFQGITEVGEEGSAPPSVTDAVVSDVDAGAPSDASDPVRAGGADPNETAAEMEATTQALAMMPEVSGDAGSNQSSRSAGVPLSTGSETAIAPADPAGTAALDDDQQTAPAEAETASGSEPSTAGPVEIAALSPDAPTSPTAPVNGTAPALSATSDPVAETRAPDLGTIPGGATDPAAPPAIPQVAGGAVTAPTAAPDGTRPALPAGEAPRIAALTPSAPGTAPRDVPAGLPDSVETPEAQTASPSGGDDPASDTGASVTATVDAPAVPETPAAPAAPRVLKIDQSGVSVVQDRVSRPDLSIDTIQYSPQGNAILGGRAPETSAVRVYIDNRPLDSVRSGEGGQWRFDLPALEERVYTLRVDQVDASGKVTARAETPFKPESAEDLDLLRGAVEDGVRRVTVQPGFTLWAIAERNYGDGFAYVKVFEANGDKIRDPDLIYPGQIFAVPETAETAE